MGDLFQSEYKPLLPGGFHLMTLADLRRLCVDAFPGSTTRSRIMDGIEASVKELHRIAFVGELWADGSFLTEKHDPKDVDLALRVESRFYDERTDPQDSILQWFNQSRSLQTEYHCDSYVWVDYARGHPNYEQGQRDRIWYAEVFGTSLSRKPKGIAVIAFARGAA